MGAEDEDEDEDSKTEEESDDDPDSDAPGEDPNSLPAGLTGGGEPSDDEPDSDAPPEGATIVACQSPVMPTYYPVYIPPMVAPPQPFGYVYQPMTDDAWRALQIDRSDFDFYKDDLTEQTQEMLNHLEIPLYGPSIKPVDG